MSRDEFSSKVKAELAARVGHRCSNPDCRAPTSGPKQLEDGKVSVGDAAHITAAAIGGPRYNPSLTADERRSASNGIWCCVVCARCIDHDKSAFSEAELRSWKVEAERLALAELGKQRLDAPRQINAAVYLGSNAIRIEGPNAVHLGPNAISIQGPIIVSDDRKNTAGGTDNG